MTPILLALAATFSLLASPIHAQESAGDQSKTEKPALEKRQRNKAEGGAKENRAQRTTFVGKPSGQGEATRLFILSGQSNMAGMDEKQTLIPKLEAAFPGDTLIIVKDSQSGQPIRRWAENWEAPEGWEGRNLRDKPGNNDLYKRLMERVKEAVAGQKIDSVSFMWMQGEADAKQDISGSYANALRGLIKQVRADVGRKDVAVVIGRISDHQNGQPDWDAVRKMQVEVAESDPLAAWIDTDELNGSVNALHYMGADMQTLSGLFAEKSIELINKKEKPCS